MKHLITFSLVLILASGCAAVRKFQAWEQLNDEKYQYAAVVETIEEAIPAALLKDCGYNLDLVAPKVTALSFEEMSKHRGASDELPSGFYNPLTNEVGYLKDDSDALLHEYQHFFDFKAQVSAEKRVRCDFEIKAYLSEYASKQRDLKEQWKRKSEQLRHELNLKQYR